MQNIIEDINICKKILDDIQKQYELCHSNGSMAHMIKSKRLVADTYLNFAAICVNNKDLRGAKEKMHQARIAIYVFAEWVGKYNIRFNAIYFREGD